MSYGRFSGDTPPPPPLRNVTHCHSYRHFVLIESSTHDEGNFLLFSTLFFRSRDILVSFDM